MSSLAELEVYMDELVEFGAPPGMSVVVVKDGAIACERAFGLADGPNAVAATTETAYHWMSMSKMPTAVAIFQLQERASLSIDDKVVATRHRLECPEALLLRPRQRKRQEHHGFGCAASADQRCLHQTPARRSLR